MKKILFFAMALLMLASCQKGSMKPNLKTEVDTISYEVGMANSAYIGNVLQQNGVDSTYIEEFIDGVKEGIMGASDKKKMARYVGIMFGMQSDMQLQGMEQQIFGNDSTQTFNRKNYLAGIINGINKRSNLKVNGQPVSPETAGEDANNHIQKLRAKQFEENKKAGIKFLNENAKKAGVKTLPNGVQYKVLTEGAGEKPKADSQVKIFYEGRLVDGTVFDSNYTQGEPMPCVPAQMISGFGAALQQMPVGSEWEIYIPYQQAYGEQSTGPIQPCSALIFKVKLVSIEAGAGVGAGLPNPGRTGTIDDMRDDQVAGN